MSIAYCERKNAREVRDQAKKSSTRRGLVVIFSRKEQNMAQNPQIRSAATPTGLLKPAYVTAIAAVVADSTFRMSHVVIMSKKRLQILFDALGRSSSSSRRPGWIPNRMMRLAVGTTVPDGHEAQDDGRAAAVARGELGARRIAIPDHNPCNEYIAKNSI
jgi:hypothetical protein